MPKEERLIVKERLWWPLYDRVAYAAAGQVNMDFFAVPRGQAAKTYADTNMWTGSVLPTGKAHRTHALRIALAPDVKIVDAQKIFKDAWLIVRLNDDLVIAERAELFTAGCGLQAMSNITAAATEYQVSNGTPSAKHIQSLGDEPLDWDNESNVEISLNWPAAQAISVAVKIVIYMDGYLVRGKVG